MTAPEFVSERAPEHIVPIGKAPKKSGPPIALAVDVSKPTQETQTPAVPIKPAGMTWARFGLWMLVLFALGIAVFGKEG